MASIDMQILQNAAFQEGQFIVMLIQQHSNNKQGFSQGANLTSKIGMRFVRLHHEMHVLELHINLRVPSSICRLALTSIYCVNGTLSPQNV